MGMGQGYGRGVRRRMKALFRKISAYLAPHDQVALDYVAKLKQGEVVRVEVVRDRSLPQLRLYWALCTMVAENASHNRTQRSISDMFCMACDHVETFRAVDGTVLEKPASLSFKRTQQDEFNEFFSRVLDLVAAEILPHLSAGELRAQLEQITGVHDYAA